MIWFRVSHESAVRLSPGLHASKGLTGAGGPASFLEFQVGWNRGCWKTSVLHYGVFGLVAEQIMKKRVR